MINYLRDSLKANDIQSEQLNKDRAKQNRGTIKGKNS
jgi:hypothetical protein